MYYHYYLAIFLTISAGFIIRPAHKIFVACVPVWLHQQLFSSSIFATPLFPVQELEINLFNQVLL